MLYLVSYDIPETKRRTKVAKILNDFGDRVQYSVFECSIDKILLDKMLLRLKKVIKEEEDSIRVYTLCAGCRKEIKLFGQGKITVDEKYYIL